MPEDFENLSKVSPGSSVGHQNPANPLNKPLHFVNKEEFVERALEDFQSPLIGYAFTILNDLDLARDVVQDTFFKLCQQEPAKVRDHLKSWLFTVCRNRSLDILRKDKRSQSLNENPSQNLPDSSLQPDEEIEQQERLNQLIAYLDRLTSNQREVIILKFQQGLTYQEIQQITGLTTSNIGFLIHSGLKRLREILPEDIRR
jgi:RNA polymerase sigma factor (sigma-70 family)